jgi:hypothetical protein
VTEQRSLVVRRALSASDNLVVGLDLVQKLFADTHEFATLNEQALEEELWCGDFEADLTTTSTSTPTRPTTR